MTLKEELEILRGEPIQVFDGDPMNIPCIETSDPEKLCKNPVVSVNMITYNHEPYIRQAIEGVMMQQTDFKFELIIGEDCSQDKTREICFEYQKKYPDKIRVLWWHENISKLGGNSRRVRAHSRGEFIAICEGDDYWIDPLKLQKQVDVMRKYPSIALCLTSGMVLKDNVLSHYSQMNEKMLDGVNPGSLLLDKYISLRDGFVLTASAFFRRDIYIKCNAIYDIFKWKLSLGDAQLWDALSSQGDIWVDKSESVVYRKHSGGLTSLANYRIDVDAAIVRLYFANVEYKNRCCYSKTIVSLLDARLRDFNNTRPAIAERVSFLMVLIPSFWRCLWFWHLGSLLVIFMFIIGRLQSFRRADTIIGLSRRLPFVVVRRMRSMFRMLF